MIGGISGSATMPLIVSGLVAGRLKMSPARCLPLPVRVQGQFNARQPTPSSSGRPMKSVKTAGKATRPVVCVLHLRILVANAKERTLLSVDLQLFDQRRSFYGDASFLGDYTSRPRKRDWSD